MLFSDEMSVLAIASATSPSLSPRPRRCRLTCRPRGCCRRPSTASCASSHSEYRGEATHRELAAVFPAARDIAAEPMPLRSIFLAIAKSGRAQNRAPHIPAATGGRRHEPDPEYLPQRHTPLLAGDPAVGRHHPGLAFAFPNQWKTFTIQCDRQRMQPHRRAWLAYGGRLVAADRPRRPCGERWSATASSGSPALRVEEAACCQGLLCCRRGLACPTWWRSA